ncbi:MAG: hypothetical protein NVSMB4_00100 [Acidimicrobiales bacterium]
MAKQQAFENDIVRPSEVIASADDHRWGVEGRQTTEGIGAESDLMRLRVVEGAVIDVPIPIPPGAAMIWATTWWADHRCPDGWASALWWPSPYHQGLVPVALQVGRYVDIGVSVHQPRFLRRRQQTYRWFGVAVHRSATEILVVGRSVSDPD